MIEKMHVDPDQPLRLKKAAAIAFPDGSLTESGLRREIARGNLVVELIAGKQFTTLNHIKEMRERCRESRKVRAYTCGTEKEEIASGLSSTERAKLAQAAASRISQKLRSTSKDTSSKSIGPTGGKVIPLKS